MRGDAHALSTAVLVCPCAYAGATAAGLGQEEAARFAVGVAGLAALGSIAPDVDHPASLLVRLSGFTLWPLAWLLSRTIGHRGQTHSLVVAAAVLLLGLLWLPWGPAFGLGYLLHILADAFTPAGCPLLWVPFVRRPEPRVRFHLLPPFARLVPIWREQEFRPDTAEPRPHTTLARMWERNTRPARRPNEPVRFDPDDYPLHPVRIPRLGEDA